MTADVARFVPKVHPASRPAEAEDPLLMEGRCVAGDPDLMLRCVVQEYAGLGWGAEQVLGLFADPDYPALGELQCRYGSAGLRERVEGLLRPARLPTFRVSVWEAPESGPEPEAIELGVLAPGRGGDDHG
jgi:hypothetical protein